MLVALAVAQGGVPDDMAVVPGGAYEPLYAPDPEAPTVTVDPFWMDRHPVSQGDFAAFVSEHPRWRRDRIPSLFADEGYLAGWTSPVEPAGPPDQPVVQVSWFAARAYCEAQGRRLPTEDEWEVAASASQSAANARGDAAWTAQILQWYGEPNAQARIGQRPANYHGIHDLHGLVWEWVDDFNNTLYGTDNRQGGDEDELLFCGAGALSAADASDYANFMRVAFRTSLEARYTTKNLGFRCATDPDAPAEALP